jgi:hypothetical protein
VLGACQVQADDHIIASEGGIDRQACGPLFRSLADYVTVTARCQDATPIDVAGRLTDAIGGFRPPPGF